MKQPVHVIGIGCIGPGAHSPEKLWKNILTGKRSFRPILPERLPKEYLSTDKSKADTTYLKYFAPVADWNFDPIKYRIPPMVAEKYDIVHWLALEVASLAFEDADINLSEDTKKRTAVIMGNSLTGEFSRSFFLRYRWPYVLKSLRKTFEETGQSLRDDSWREFVDVFERLYKSPFPSITEDSLAGGLANVISGRIANYFNLGGGAYTVDGACSSSLIAIAQAAQAIENGINDVAVTGGVDISLGPFEMIGFAKTSAFSKDDICPYDAKAAGMLPGEGGAVLILASEKLLNDTGVNSYGTLEGWGISSDGGSQGITAPDINGQMRCIRAAYEKAKYPISSVRYFEGHGTGTTVGDRVELTALRSLLKSSPKHHHSFIGSIKANIGHTKAAAGAFGTIKAIMSMNSGIIPVTTNCNIPNPVLGSPPDVLQPVFEPLPWEPSEKVRRVGVSAMGFGGSNAHLTLEKKVKNINNQFIRNIGYYPHTECIFPVSAISLEDLLRQLEHLKKILCRISFGELNDLSATLIDRDNHSSFRAAFVGKYPDELRMSVTRMIQGLKNGESPESLNTPAQGLYYGVINHPPRVIMLFPGQGSQFPTMGRFLYKYDHLFKKNIDKFNTLFNRNNVLRDAVCKNPVLMPKDAAKKMRHRLIDTVTAQPTIVGVSLAVFNTLKACGISPDVCVGHSLGEISSFAAAGALTHNNAIRTAYLRGKAMAEASGKNIGGMAAIHAELSVVSDIVNAAGNITIANYNAPEQFVISGSKKDLQLASALCKRENIGFTMLDVSHAFHSSHVSKAAKTFRNMLKSIPTNKAMNANVISTMDGEFISTTSGIRDRLATHIAAPVRFIDAIKSASIKSEDIIIECGPGQTLSKLVSQITGKPVNTMNRTLSQNRYDPADLFHSIAAAYTKGVKTNMEHLRTIMRWNPFPYNSYNPSFIVNPCEKTQSAELEKHIVHQTEETSSLYEKAVSWIAARTGFAEETIKPEMKLRDDLSLDSIKTGELALNLARTLNSDLSIGDPTIFSNASVIEIVESIRSAHEGNHNQAALRREKKALVAPDGGIGSWHYIFDIRHRRLDNTILSEDSGFDDWDISVLILVSGNPKSAENAINHFKNEWANVYVIPADKFIKESFNVKKYNLCIYIPDASKNASISAMNDGSATHFFRIMSRFLKGRSEQNSRFAFIVLRFFPADSEMPGHWMDAAAGLLKTIHLEYRRSIMKWLTIPNTLSPSKIIKAVHFELSSNDMQIMIRYNENMERFFFCAETPAEHLPGGPELISGDVIVVTGGARGITYDHVRILTEEYEVAVALIGSSPLITVNNDEKYQNIMSLRAKNITVKYYQCDVSSANNVKKVIKRIKQEMGPVKGIIHGAGMSSYHRFRDLDEKTYMRAVEVKVHGCMNILKYLGHKGMSQLKLFHVISSVLARTGMRNQASYVFANSWLDEMIHVFRHEYPAVHAVSIGYTVWRDTGMASGKNSNVLKYLSSIGVEPLRPAMAKKHYRTILTSKDSAAVFTITGRLTPDLENNLFLPYRPPESLRYIENIIRHIPGVELVSESTVSLEKDPVIKHHAYKGTYIFPLVMYLEMAAQATLTLLDKTITIFSNITVHTPLIIFSDEVLRLRLYCIKNPDENKLRIAIRSERDDFLHNLMIADLSTEPLYSKHDADSKDMPSKNSTATPDDFHPHPLFQGNMLRAISTIYSVNHPQSADVSITVPTNVKYFSTSLPQTLVAGSPAARDSYLQTALIARGELLLPHHIKTVKIYQKANPGEQLRCHVVNDTITITDKTGLLIEEIIGVKTRKPGISFDKNKSFPNITHVRDLLANNLEASIDIDIIISLKNITTKSLLSKLINKFLTAHGTTNIKLELKNNKRGAIVLNPLEKIPFNLFVSAATSGPLKAGIVGRNICGIDLEVMSNIPPTESLRNMTGTIGSFFKVPNLNEHSSYIFSWLFIESWKKAFGEAPSDAPLFVKHDNNFYIFKSRKGSTDVRFYSGTFSYLDGNLCFIGILSEISK